MTDLTDAIARIKAVTAECGQWSSDDFLHTLFTPDTAAALGLILNLVATGEMVRAPVWQLPPEAERPDGFRCLSLLPIYGPDAYWIEVRWDATDKLWFTPADGEPLGPTKFAPLPAPPEAAP